MLWSGILSIFTTPIILYLSQRKILQSMNKKSIVIFSFVISLMLPYAYFLLTAGIPCSGDGCFTLFYYPLNLQFVPMSAYPWHFTRVEFLGVPVQPPAVEGVWYPENGMIFISVMIMEYLACGIGWIIGVLLSLRPLSETYPSMTRLGWCLVPASSSGTCRVA